MIIKKCKDCGAIIETKEGAIGERIVWSLCDRCRAKRNGFIGAKTLREVGIA